MIPMKGKSRIWRRINTIAFIAVLFTPWLESCDGVHNGLETTYLGGAILWNVVFSRAEFFDDDMLKFHVGAIGLYIFILYSLWNFVISYSNSKSVSPWLGRLLILSWLGIVSFILGLFPDLIGYSFLERLYEFFEDVFDLLLWGFWLFIGVMMSCSVLEIREALMKKRVLQEALPDPP